MSSPSRWSLVGVIAVVAAVLAVPRPVAAEGNGPPLLTDPFLQLPTANGTAVAWFTEWPGSRHLVGYGDWVRTADAGTMVGRGSGIVVARTTKLTQSREDPESKVPGTSYDKVTDRPVWRHEATVSNLRPGTRVPYRVASIDGDRVSLSDVFTLAPAARPGEAQQILLTSDHQLRKMTPANTQLVAERFGGELDGVFMAGDLVNVPDRASEWFDDVRGLAFFPGLQGRATVTLGGRNWQGGKLIQNLPLYTALGNHERMGRRSTKTLKQQFDDAWPRHEAERAYAEVADQVNPGNDPAVKAQWIEDHTFNATTYEQIFTLPRSGPGGERYYAETVGNIRLIVLDGSAVWRPPFLTPETRQGKFREASADLTNRDAWGFGQHIFEPIAAGTEQYRWLERELASPASRTAKYRVVMLHQAPHGVGDNTAPAFADPVQIVDRDPATGEVTGVRYEYPFHRDQLLRDVEPLLSRHGVELVLGAHSHLWNRFRNAAGINFLEASNVGNSFGAFVPGGASRNLPGPEQGYHERYIKQGDPGGLDPIVPNVAPLTGPDGKPLPYLSSATITAFSILDTAAGVVRSYRFDTDKPESPLVLFDELPLD